MVIVLGSHRLFLLPCRFDPRPRPHGAGIVARPIAVNPWTAKSLTDRAIRKRSRCARRRTTRARRGRAAVVGRDLRAVSRSRRSGTPDVTDSRRPRFTPPSGRAWLLASRSRVHRARRDDAELRAYRVSARAQGHRRLVGMNSLRHFNFEVRPADRHILVELAKR